MTAATIVLAPYGDPDPAVRRWHTERAALVVAMLHREGVPAACIHRAIDAGDYGDDADPEARVRGLAASQAITACFPRAFALLRDDGTMSSGTAADVDAWKLAWFMAADEDVDLTDDEYDEVCDLVGAEYDNWLVEQMGPGPEEA